MRYAIIVLVLCVGSFFFRKYSLRKKEELTQDPLTTPEHFTIKGWNGIPTWPFWLALVFCLILFVIVLSYKDIGLPALIVVSITPIMGILMTIFVLYVCYIWRIDVDGNTISFRNLLGKRIVFDISEISRVVAIPKRTSEYDFLQIVLPVFDYSYVFYKDEKKLFTIDEYTDNVYLVQRLEERGVQVEKRLNLKKVI